MVDTKFSVSVHLMTTLAYNSGRLTSSDELATGLRTNASFVRKLVVYLSDAGLIESVRGKSGGLRLALPAKKITLDKIYDAVAGHKIICVPDKTAYKQCAVSCIMGDLLKKISDSIEHSARQQLSKTNLQDLLSEIK